MSAIPHRRLALAASGNGEFRTRLIIVYKRKSGKYLHWDVAAAYMGDEWIGRVGTRK